MEKHDGVWIVKLPTSRPATAVGNDSPERRAKTQIGDGNISPYVKLNAAAPRANVQIGEGNVSPHVKLNAAPRAKARIGEGNVSPYVKLHAT